MRAKTNYFLIGLFVIIGAGLIVFGVTVLGAGALLQATIMTETYVTESVQGLEVGSPVRFRGLRIGQVREITLASKYYDTQQPWILVRMSVLKEMFPHAEEGSIREHIETLVSKGLRMRLASQGLTGAGYIESDLFEPGRFPTLSFDWTPQVLYIPSAPSTVTRISSSLETILENLKQADFPGVGASASKALNAVADTLREADVAAVSKDVQRLLQSMHELIDATRQNLDKTMGHLATVADHAQSWLGKLDHAIDPQQLSGTLAQVSTLAKELTDTAVELRSTLRRSNALLQALDQTVVGRAGDLQATIANLRVLTEQLANLAGTLERYPSLLLFGEQPQPVKLK